MLNPCSCVENYAQTGREEGVFAQLFTKTTKTNEKTITVQYVHFTPYENLIDPVSARDYSCGGIDSS
ncbi:hypothetical protein GCM10007390_35410 [Persicitalea jodogahamensis]|uniref:Uncharacterized protein n=1 Tax=Persicitalea jodogahamensis TaxID=402147 RepID=A0A8J3GBL3_9BACT|nr:hypothetical protein GCM10007390_35410 [Persicitalea jodogahamensis]